MRAIFRVSNKKGEGPIVNPAHGYVHHMVTPLGSHYCGVTIQNLPNPPLGRFRLDKPLDGVSNHFARANKATVRICTKCLYARFS